MDDSVMSKIAFALLGAGGGTLLLKLADKWIPDAGKRGDDQASFRKELRDEATILRTELRQARQDYATLHKQYVDLSSQHFQLQGAYTTLEKTKADLERSFGELSAQAAALKVRCDSMAEELRRLR
jgi:chromosome segregation ATPase